MPKLISSTYFILVCFISLHSFFLPVFSWAEKTTIFNNLKNLKEEKTFEHLMKEAKENIQVPHSGKIQDNFPHPVRDPFLSQLPQIKAILENKMEETIGETTSPFSPTGTKQTITIVRPALQTMGLIWNTQKPQAIINDTVVNEGDTINDSKILSIKPNGVKVMYQGEEFDFSY